MDPIHCIIFLGLQVVLTGHLILGQHTSHLCDEGDGTCLKLESERHNMLTLEILKELSDIKMKLQSETEGSKHEILNRIEETKGLENDLEEGEAIIGMVISYNGHTYIIPEDRRTWEDARKDCLSRKYDLAYFDSPAEHYYMKSVLESHPSLSKEPNYWLAGTDQEHEGCWIWTAPNITKVPHNEQWGTGEPNKGVSENCLNLRWDGTTNLYHLNDYPCDEQTRYICKRPSGKPVTSMVSSWEYINTPVCGNK